MNNIYVKKNDRVYKVQIVDKGNFTDVFLIAKDAKNYINEDELDLHFSIKENKYSIEEELNKRGYTKIEGIK